MNVDRCFFACAVTVMLALAFLSGRAYSDICWMQQCIDRGVAHWEVDDRGNSTFVWDYELKEPDHE